MTTLYMHTVASLVSVRAGPAWRWRDLRPTSLRLRDLRPTSALVESVEFPGLAVRTNKSVFIIQVSPDVRVGQAAPLSQLTRDLLLGLYSRTAALLRSNK